MAGAMRSGGRGQRKVVALPAWYGGSALVLALVTFAIGRLVGHADPADAALSYLLVVLLASTVERLGLGLWTAVLAALLLNYFFLPPIGTLTVANPANWFALAAFLATAVVTSQLVARARQGRRAAEERERQTLALLALSEAVAQSLAQVAAVSPETLCGDLAVACARSLEASSCLIEVRRPFAARCLVGEADGLSAEAVAVGAVVPPGRAERFADIGDRTATWVSALGPGGGVDGLLCAAVPAGGVSDAATALEATVRLATLTLERAWLAREAAATEAARQSEAFKSVLLSGVSHELRTPLAAIRLSATALLRPEVWTDDAARAELLDTLDQEAARLNARVGSLLAMSRLESGALVLDLAEVDAREVVAAALRHLGPSADPGRLRVRVPEGLGAARADVALAGVALANLIDNAVKYSPADALVAIEAACAGDRLRLEVADRGPGLAEGELERVFERFYRAPSARRGPSPGSGLGLSIARALAEAHGGTVRALARPGGGSVFVLELPRAGEADAPGRPAARSAADAWVRGAL